MENEQKHESDYSKLLEAQEELGILEDRIAAWEIENTKLVDTLYDVRQELEAANDKLEQIRRIL